LHILAIAFLTVATSGCSLALPAYNEPLQERIHLVTQSPESFAIRIDGSGGDEVPVPKSGLVVLDIPVLPRECSTYLLGIRIKDRRVEARSIIQIVRRGEVVKTFSINGIRKMPADSGGYREVRVG
jgi:hypothetical protein